MIPEKKKLSIGKKLIFTLLLIGIFILPFEVISFVILRIKYGNDWINSRDFAENYKEVIRTTSHYCYHKDLKLILPIPGTVITLQRLEFVDRFPIADIGGLGFFDDGLNEEKKIKAVALGDSFTRGVGSTDNIRFGWVEKVERSLKDTDIINLGNSGASTINEVQFYNKIKGRLDHDIVILNFFTGGDFNDNIKKFHDFSEYVLSASDGIDETEFIRKFALSRNYSILNYFLAYSPIRPWTFRLGLKLYEKLISKYPPFSELAKFNKKAMKELEAYQKKKTPENWKAFSRLNRIQEESQDKRLLFTYYPSWYDRQEWDKVRNVGIHSASLINDFFQTVSREGKKFILLIHPSKEEIYLVKEKGGSFDFNRLRNYFKKKLHPDIPFLDLTQGLRKKAENSDKAFYYRLDGHYTPIGYEAVANLVVDFLKMKGLR